MTTQTEVTQKTHRRAVRFFWCLLIGAATISLIGNVVHAAMPYVPKVVIQVGAATVPPIALLAAVHGIALAVRAGASGRTYPWAVSAVAAIGLGAFTVSFLALRDLMQQIGYSPATAWIFPAVIDTTVAVSTMMLVALGDKPARRSHAVNRPTSPRASGPPTPPDQAGAVTKAQSGGSISTGTSQPKSVLAAQAAQVDAASNDADLASELVASRITTQPVETVIAVLAARREGATVNAAAKALRINYRTAQRIVEAAEARQNYLASTG